jgi:hypothetical protein
MIQIGLVSPLIPQPVIPQRRSSRRKTLIQHNPIPGGPAGTRIGPLGGGAPDPSRPEGSQQRQNGNQNQNQNLVSPLLQVPQSTSPRQRSPGGGISPHRRRHSPNLHIVHYPSWDEMSEFDFSGEGTPMTPRTPGGSPRVWGGGSPGLPGSPGSGKSVKWQRASKMVERDGVRWYPMRARESVVGRSELES